MVSKHELVLNKKDQKIYDEIRIPAFEMFDCIMNSEKYSKDFKIGFQEGFYQVFQRIFFALKPIYKQIGLDNNDNR